MKSDKRGGLQTIIDREKLMTYKTGPACGRPFTLGDPVVLACGAWDGPPRWVHENEAVFDPQTGSYTEEKCAMSMGLSDK